MLLNLSSLITKYQMKITGVIHCGAHTGEEDPEYLKHGIQIRHYFEPHPETFSQLLNNVQADCWQVALGASDTTAKMHVETFNKGQSNSLLEPGTHLKHYPKITFDSTIEVPVMPLDDFEFTDSNLLNMDVQGYELEILKGATETLKYIDYIYTEVNTEEVYQNCGKLSELDAFLSDYIRVETMMTGQGWGDALYITKRIAELC